MYPRHLLVPPSVVQCTPSFHTLYGAPSFTISHTTQAMHSDQFGFFVEWEDTQADLVREYQLSYFVRTDARPNEVSMVRHVATARAHLLGFYMPRAPAKPARCWVFAASRSTSPIRVYGGLVRTA